MVAEPEHEELEEALVASLAELSTGRLTPTGVTSPARIEPAAIRFDDRSWVGAVKNVEGWLRFASPLADESDYEGWVESLAENLATSQPHLENGEPSERLLDALRLRVDIALRLRESFLEALETKDQPIQVATSSWVADWEDAETDLEPDPPEPITATTSVWAINDFAAKARKNQLNLSPSYQRGDVWQTTEAQLLIESILRGIPLPSLILLKPDNPTEPHEVVDGKQRLTAILRFIGSHPDALEHVRRVDEETDQQFRLRELFATDYPKFRKAWKNATGQSLSSSVERELYFPFPLRSSTSTLTGDLSDLAGKYFTQIRDTVIGIAETREDIDTLFMQTSEYRLPIIIYQRATARQIHEVFKLYNKQGKHLNAEEIRNAVFHELDLMRGILVASGDADDVSAVAPFLRGLEFELEDLQSELSDSFRVSSLRYRRSKILAWILSTLLFDAPEQPVTGLPMLKSTSGQTDQLLTRVETNPSDPLRDVATLRSLFALVARAAQAVSLEPEIWESEVAAGVPFRGRKTGWDDLQIVGATVGLCALATISGEKFEDLVTASAQALADRVGGLQRPRNAQTLSQWRFIAQIANGILEASGVAPGDADLAVRERFGSSGLKGLVKLAQAGD